MKALAGEADDGLVKALWLSKLPFSLLPKAQAKGKLTQQALTLSAANQTDIHTYGARKMLLNLGLQRDFECDVIVADVPHAILGADFLARHGLLPDLQKRRLIDRLTGLSAPGHLAMAGVFSVSTIIPARGSDCLYAQQYTQLLQDFKDVFEPSSTPIRVPDLPVRHTITTTGPPVSERPRRLAGEKLAAAKRAFAELLERGIIRPSSS
ncbi:uncharacterized protein LOC106645102 [Copidosoma floridanum]|uniref:uncharacterized protein LOC106645102 n=1 Tax=Copidosoma floridanum TaxID=29053 RepID=UPI0006C99818|nr:uncharacterized protein LOC106645102 [Copidosoma floridanum]